MQRDTTSVVMCCMAQWNGHEVTGLAVSHLSSWHFTMWKKENRECAMEMECDIEREREKRFVTKTERFSNDEWNFCFIVAKWLPDHNRWLFVAFHFVLTKSSQLEKRTRRSKIDVVTHSKSESLATVAAAAAMATTPAAHIQCASLVVSQKIMTTLSSRLTHMQSMIVEPFEIAKRKFWGRQSDILFAPVFFSLRSIQRHTCTHLRERSGRRSKVVQMYWGDEFSTVMCVCVGFNHCSMFRLQNESKLSRRMTLRTCYCSSYSKYTHQLLINHKTELNGEEAKKKIVRIEKQKMYRLFKWFQFRSDWQRMVWSVGKVRSKAYPIVCRLIDCYANTKHN